MIILNLKGGLGNQLFQLNAALFLSKNKKEKIILYINNLSKYPPPRKYSLEPFIYNSEAEIIKSNFKSILLSTLAFKFYSIMLNRNKTDNIYKFLNFKILDGYFQDYKYFTSNTLEIINKSMNISIDKSFFKNFDNLTSYNGIHVRGTDRSKNFNYNLESINNIFANKNQTLLCFTDDISFAKNVLSKLTCNILYLSDLKLSEFEEFYLLSKLKTCVIVNSTFSIFSRLFQTEYNKTFIINDTFKKRDDTLLELVYKQPTFIFI